MTWAMTPRNSARDRLEKGEVAIGVLLRQARTVDIAGHEDVRLRLAFPRSRAQFDVARHGGPNRDGRQRRGYCAAPAHPCRPLRHGDACAGRRSLGHRGARCRHAQQARERRPAQYPPLGHRSIAGTMPQFDFESRPPPRRRRRSRWPPVGSDAETPQAIGNAEGIVAVPVSMRTRWSEDLCVEMGIPEDFLHRTWRGRSRRSPPPQARSVARHGGYRHRGGPRKICRHGRAHGLAAATLNLLRRRRSKSRVSSCGGGRRVTVIAKNLARIRDTLLKLAGNSTLVKQSAAGRLSPSSEASSKTTTLIAEIFCAQGERRLGSRTGNARPGNRLSVYAS